MATIISIEQGGTGVQTVSNLKKLLDLGTAASADKSDDYKSDSHDTVPSSYALNKALAETTSEISGVVPIENGGTGATTKEEAIKNLGIENTVVQYPISVDNGGTGAVVASLARHNLGIDFPLPIENGGTGANTKEKARENLDLTFPLPLTAGGTGAISAYSARNNLGLQLPLAIESGGTGADSLDKIITNLKLNYFITNEINNGEDLNTKLLSGIYRSIYTDADAVKNVPIPGLKRYIMLVMSSCTEDTSPIGRLTQLLFTLNVDPSDNEDFFNRCFYRNYHKTPDVNLEAVWSPWVEIMVTSNGVVPVNKGGTGAKTAADARTNLEIPEHTISTGNPSGGKNGDIWFKPVS